MQLAKSMVKSIYIAQKWGRRGSVLSSGTNRSKVGGKPYSFSQWDVDELQEVITGIGQELMDVKIIQVPQSQEDYPLCYGVDMVEKFKTLGKVIKLPYLFCTVMERPTTWQGMHLCNRASACYNKFTDEELTIINEGIRTIALKLCSIQLQCTESNTRKNKKRWTRRKGELEEEEWMTEINMTGLN